MENFSLENRPLDLGIYRKKSTVRAAFIAESFTVETQEGKMTISPETVDDWDGGYYVMYPSDGSKPYACAPSFFKTNYIVA